MLRHTHATLLFVNGANLKDIQERLGNSRIDITLNTYSHLTKKVKKKLLIYLKKLLNKICHRFRLTVANRWQINTYSRSIASTYI
jgi:hypothetical protein